MYITIYIYFMLIMFIFLAILLYSEYHLKPVNDIKGKLYHFTTEKNASHILIKEDVVHLKPFGKCCSPKGVYFFKKKPTAFERLFLRVQGLNHVIIIDANNEEIDKNNLYSRVDNSIVYTTEYKGTGYVLKAADAFL